MCRYRLTMTETGRWMWQCIEMVYGLSFDLPTGDRPRCAGEDYHRTCQCRQTTTVMGRPTLQCTVMGYGLSYDPQTVYRRRWDGVECRKIYRLIKLYESTPDLTVVG